VVFSYVTSATATNELLKGLYKVSGSVSGTQISGGTWSSTTINIGTASGGHGGGGPGGGGGGPQRP
ncbi:MAG: TIGR04222 domain-containing membrane protein, partial [Bacilli bacterium]|nr:TIGR04222 domain-containing membrane protein [Bacilli bacterium]